MDTNAVYEFKQLEWEYFTPPRKNASDVYPVHAVSSFLLPQWIVEKRGAGIEIAEYPYHHTPCYQATMWWFNRGVQMVGLGEAQTVNQCIELVNERLFEFATLFLSKIEIQNK